MERKDIQKEYKWKTEDLFESDEAWEAEFRAAEQELSQTDFSVYSGKLADKQTLLACLQKMDEVAQIQQTWKPIHENLVKAKNLLAQMDQKRKSL